MGCCLSGMDTMCPLPSEWGAGAQGTLEAHGSAFARSDCILHSAADCIGLRQNDISVCCLGFLTCTRGTMEVSKGIVAMIVSRKQDSVSLINISQNNVGAFIVTTHYHHHC